MPKQTKLKARLCRDGKRRAKHRSLSSKGVKVGEICPLDIETPYGLFETFDGDWYLITDDGTWKLAIVLAHAELPSFACLRLKPQPLTGSRWWGEFNVRAGVPTDERYSREVGLLSDSSFPTLSLQCHTPFIYTQWVDVGEVTARHEKSKNLPADGLCGSDYDQWTIICAHDDRPVVTKCEDGTLILGKPETAHRYAVRMKVQPLRI
jgi:hypothetical protein